MKKNLIRKEIAYAFPYSPMAEKLGFEESGCYYVESHMCNIEGSGQFGLPYPDNSGGFETIENDLIDSFHEADGEPWTDAIAMHPERYKRS